MSKLLAAVLCLFGVLGSARAAELPTAVFAGGCFWCVEADFDQVPGVIETVSGYAGGTLANPSYEQVSAGGTGHYEAVRVTYDPAKVSYADLLTAFWHSVDPTDPDGQFCDRGESYRTAVFVDGPAQQAAAEQSKQAAEEALGRPVATAILPADRFWPAEDYHQAYYEKNPLRYGYYRWRCGRDARVEQVWGERAFAGIPAKQKK